MIVPSQQSGLVDIPLVLTAVCKRAGLTQEAGLNNHLQLLRSRIPAAPGDPPSSDSGDPREARFTNSLCEGCATVLAVPVVMHHAETALPMDSATSVYGTLRSQEAELHQQTFASTRHSPKKDFLNVPRVCFPPWVAGFFGVSSIVSSRGRFLGRRPYEKPKICILAGGSPPPPMVRLQNCGTGKWNETRISKFEERDVPPKSCARW